MSTTAQTIKDSFKFSHAIIAEQNAVQVTEMLYEDELGDMYEFEDESRLFIGTDGSIRVIENENASE